MNAIYKRSLDLGQTLISSYSEVVKHTLPGIIALVIMNLIFPHTLTFLFSIFVFGMLYLNSYAILMGNTPPTLKEIFFFVGKKYIQALTLTISVIAICIFAFVGPAVPIDLLPNSWLSKILAFGPFDIFLLMIFTLLFIATAIYVSYSLMFFWLENSDVLGSLERSYKLVKGQWWRAALYFSLSNIIPLILFVILPGILLCLMAAAVGIDTKVVMNSGFIQLVLFSLVAGLVFPIQTILNVSFFQKLKTRKSE